jgi:hypothetical protein
MLANVLIDGATPPDRLVVPPRTDIALSVDADDTAGIVNWLTSCGSMHDYDLHRAYLRVEPDDAQVGELGLVVRDTRGGVAWQVWAISAR